MDFLTDIVTVCRAGICLYPGSSSLVRVHCIFHHPTVVRSGKPYRYADLAVAERAYVLVRHPWYRIEVRSFSWTVF